MCLGEADEGMLRENCAHLYVYISSLQESKTGASLLVPRDRYYGQGPEGNLTELRSLRQSDRRCIHSPMSALHVPLPAGPVTLYFRLSVTSEAAVQRLFLSFCVCHVIASLGFVPTNTEFHQEA